MNIKEIPSVSLSAKALLLGVTLTLCLPPPAAASSAIFDGTPMFVSTDRHVIEPITARAPTAFNIEGSHTLHLQGPISDSGVIPARLYKLGSGTLALSGNNTHGGNTLLIQGHLLLAHDSALGQDYNGLDANIGTRLEFADGITIRNSLRAHPMEIDKTIDPAWLGAMPVTPTADPLALQWVVEDGEARFHGSLFGSAPIIKLGQGTLRFDGMGMIHDGGITVRQGALHVNGSLGGVTRVETGATLRGTGLLGSAWIGGTLAPGGLSLGRLSVQNSLAFAPGAQYRVRVAEDGSADQVHVAGTATLAGHVGVHALPGEWNQGTQHTILQADHGLAGTRFDSVAANLPYLRPQLSYEADRVILTLHIDRPKLEAFADPGAASWRSAMIEDSRYVREAALAHTGSGRTWAQSWFAGADRDPRQGLRGAQWGDTRDISGVLVGTDRAISKNWNLNLFAGAQHVNYRSTGSSGTEGSVQLRSAGAHAGLGLARRFDGDWQLALGLAHARHRSHGSRRPVANSPSLDASQNAHSTQAWLELAARPVAQTRWRIHPWGQLAWVRLAGGGYTETGGPAALDVQRGRDSMGFSTLGLQAVRAWHTPHGPATVQARLGWHAALGAKGLHSTQTFAATPSGPGFEADGQPLARHALRLYLAVDAPIARRIGIRLGYTGLRHSGGSHHGVVFGMSVSL
ncbi:MAG: autotransporter domain-containing protein [Alcaligenaceae bacterium]|nr:autotransporter domain-containing protein [Alcaligenaceae bacterium]